MPSDPNLEPTLARIRPLEPAWIDRARARQAELTKPPGSLGKLEEIANRVAAIEQTLSPTADPAKIVLFAADHGVCDEGVNPYPQTVTAQMVANFLRGGAAINAIAKAAGADLEIIDAGVAYEIPETAGLIRRPIARGTKNFCARQAMTREQAVASLALGVGVANQAAAEKYALLGIGEMGIGNTTSASAIAAALTGAAVREVVGRGTGADDAGLARKRSAVERALALHRNRLGEPLGILECVGGFEIGAMCGVCLGAAANRRAVLVDGFIATAAAALAVRFSSAVRDYLFAAHRSTEPGHAALLEILEHRPLLDLEMRLGEGTGAALAIPILRAAAAAFTEMATFSSAGVAGKGAS